MTAGCRHFLENKKPSVKAGFYFLKVIEIFILSLIQGVTEFLPISSSSHLIIASDYLKLENNLSIDVSLHIGSFLAVLAYFYKDILNFYENKVLFIKIVIFNTTRWTNSFYTPFWLRHFLISILFLQASIF